MSGERPLIIVICTSPLLSPLLAAAGAASGGEARAVADADSVLSLWEQGAQPALILVELVLGRETGFRAVRRLRERCACPLVILSGTGRASDAAWGLDAGATQVLGYPLRAASLRALLPMGDEAAA